jgi:p-cumate 2,3-dioxygenase ferredoxin subunit
MSWITVAAVRDLLPGKVLRVDPDDPEVYPIAVYNVNGTYFATDDTCTHGAASLGDEGYLDGTTIECGLHGGSFDVTSGAATGLPCTIALHRYATKVEDDVVYVSTDPTA